MTNDPKKAAAAKQADPKAASASPAPPTPPVSEALFRKLDWIVAGITTLLVLIGYIYTMAPDVTLEDSGELAVASFYAGVPHPPGYPVWTIYTWLFTVLFPISNIAWRVTLSSAVAAAFSCGVLSLIVSRGSSMMIEGIADLKNLDKKIENQLCAVAGFLAGMLLGFNGFMWSQAVIVEVYTLSVLTLTLTMVFLLRWIHTPHKMKYLYWMAFMFGICLTTHQTLIVAAMGIEVAILAANPKLGRNVFTVNTLFYFFGLYLKRKGVLTSFDNNPSLFFIYNMVGVGSLAAAVGAWWHTREDNSTPWWKEWIPTIVMGLMVFLGAAFYFYMPLASMTNPPMNWGYPRTEQGFWHALTRGQYDKTSPTAEAGRFFEQIIMYITGAIEEFNFVYLMIGLVPWLYFSRMQKRERAWMIGSLAIYLTLAVLLMVLLNPNTDRQSREQARVFFTASHVTIAMAIGYGISLIGATLVLYYERYRQIALISAAIAAGVAVYGFAAIETQFMLDKYRAMLSLALALVAVGVLWINTVKFPIRALLLLVCLMPFYSIMAHWADNEQRGHLFGFYFGHDMFTPPYDVYPEMTKNAILFGGTDPGRFNPTYMIFCESFTPPEKKRDPKFDRRDVYLITQNALADETYLQYIRAHYNRSTQIDPPFFVNFLRSTKDEFDGRTNALAKMFVPLDRYFTDLGARIEERRRKEGVYPEKEINTPSPEDYQIAFTNYIYDAQMRLQHDIAFPNEPKQLKPGEDVRYVDGKVSIQGQVAVMAINGLLTKVIFDKNPNNEFFVEESFPLDWMFPHLTPYGIIMKINRQPVGEFTQEIIDKDHQFWSKYSERLVGNWITYDTSVKEICEFAERVYLRRDFKGFNGAREFVRDDNAQKAFSKLRSAIANLYYYRLSQPKGAPENQRCLKEAEFAYKQAFAFCPYSPEAVFRYVNLLINLNRHEEAELIVKTCIKFDPDNRGMYQLLANVQEIRKSQSSIMSAQNQLATAEANLRTNPANLEAAFQLVSTYIAVNKTNEAYAVLQRLVDQENVDPQTVLTVAGAFSQLGHMVGLESTLRRLVTLMPDSPEAWYDLARAQTVVRKVPEALQSLDKAVQMSNARLATNAAARNLAVESLKEGAFGTIRHLPEFLRVVGQSAATNAP